MEKKRIQDLTDRQRSWLKHLKKCSASGMSRRGYAKAHSLNYSIFEKMRRQLGRHGVWNEPEPDATPAPIFQKVPVSGSALRSSSVRVICPNGVEVQISGSLDIAGIIDRASHRCPTIGTNLSHHDG